MDVHKLKGIVKDYTSLASASVCSSLLRMISLFILTIYLLNPEVFGTYSLALVAGGIMVFGVNWFFPSLVRYGREEIEKRKTMNGSFWSGLLVTAILVVTISTF